MTTVLTDASRYSLACEGLNIEIANRQLVRELTFSAYPGSITCVLGCNGTGKTLTLHTLAGARSATSGNVLVGGKALRAWPQRHLARHLGLLAQTDDDPFPATVLESVLIGRHPHLDFWSWETTQDREIAAAALRAVDLGEFGERSLVTLSGGERRRAAIAILLTQNPDVMLLDEPVNHLDPHHQIDVMELLRRKADEGHTIIASLHDAGLAARFADQALLLFGDGRWQHGDVATVLNEATLSKLYGTAVRELRWNEGRTFVASATGRAATWEFGKD